MAVAQERENISFVLQKPYTVTFEPRPKPGIGSPYDVLIAIKYTGICGSDVHFWVEGRLGPFIVESPLVLGHEASGTVITTGTSVTTLVPGDRVAIEPGTPCRRCSTCLSGNYHLCNKMKFAATPNNDGTLTGYYTAPEDFCYKLPSHITLQEGALIEPLAVAVHIIKQAGIVPGQNVLIMGAGPVGLLCCAVAKCFGATKIVAVDIQPARLEFAKTYAATHTFAPAKVAAEENAQNLLESCELGDGADAVIDASGAESSIQCSLYAVRRGGTFVQGGMGKSDINFPIMALCMKEVTAKGSFRYKSGDYKLAIELVISGRVDVKRLITSTVVFEDAEEAFRNVKAGKGIKILIAGPMLGN